jgi:peptide/nickel transport system ATP-binding protein
VQAIPHLSGRRELIGIPGRAPSPGARPRGCTFAPRCTFVLDACRSEEPALRALEPELRVRCIRAEEVRASVVSRAGRLEEHVEQASVSDAVLTLDGVYAGYGAITVVHDINLQLAPHECLALVGESGSGKTTLARSIAGLHRDRSGAILLRDQPLESSARGRTREARQSIQYVFQNPYGSLNPRKTIGQIVRQPLGVFGTATGAAADKRVGEMLDRVSLAASYLDRYPDQLSGGERQRVAIARALVVSPSVLVCDEVTSALDVSVQAAIVELLAELQRELGLAMLFVTHNLPLVRSIAQRVAVMSSGRIVELGTVEHVLQSPSDDYTQRLLADTPSLETATA